ncbi:MAG: chorismate synthase [Paludibacteraceae bacterium]|nr:chorismate synthase [Paludibacteraceae bacterium]
MNSFGTSFTFTSFGESHSRAIGGVLDGVPAGLHIDFALIREALDRRAGRLSAAGVSPRAKREPDEVEWLSGVLDGVTLGTPIAFLIRNRDARPEDYEWLKHSFRQGHADWTYQYKYGTRDWRGGGRASARETAARVVAGTIALQMLSERGISVHAELVQVGEATDPACFDEVIRAAGADGDSVGGIVRCCVTGLPAGLGEPVFDKLQSHLAFAMMSINACKGFDYGSGFEGVALRGSEANRVSGGMLGGISDGTMLSFRCVFKPTPTTARSLSALQSQITNPQSQITNPQSSVNSSLSEAHQSIISQSFRSDVCIAVRAVPVVESMAALVLCDFLSLSSNS